MRGAALPAIAAALLAVPAAGASIPVATSALSPALRVDARGNAEVSWSSGGRRLTLLVTADGRRIAGGRLSAADASRPARGPRIPFQRALRAGPAGWYYGLQAWRVQAGGPVQLRFSRWQGVPTEIELAAAAMARGVRLRGRVTLDGKPLPPATQTRYAYVDSRIDGAWLRLGRYALSSTGTFQLSVPDDRLGSEYRAVVPGPNLGGTLAPDAASVVPAPPEIDGGR